jgi:hypothetical protein
VTFTFTCQAELSLELEMFEKKFEEKLQKKVSNKFLSFENCAVYEIMWKKCGRARQPTGDGMAHAQCSLHLQYVMLIACPLQQWVYERSSMLRYTSTYPGCIVCIPK